MPLPAPRRRGASATLLLLCTAAATACVDTSPDRVKLTAEITDVSFTVAQSSLVTSLSGSFALHLNLGDLAQESATVSNSPTFQLVTAQNRSTVTALDAVVQGATLPVTVAPGGSTVLSYKLNDQASIAQDAITTICSGNVLVTGTLKDSSNGDQPLTVDSAPTKPAGCP